MLVESVQDYAIFMLGPEGHVRTWNEGARRLKGYEPHEIIGRHFSNFYPDYDLASGKPAMELEVASRVGRFEDEGFRIRKDGSTFWANVVITALRNRKGTLVGFSKVTRDLTERRNAEEQLRQSEERLRALIEGVQDYALYMLDPTGIIMSWNTGAQRLKGYSASEVIGKHFSMFFRPEDVAAGIPEGELRQALTEGRFEAEAIRLRKDGAEFWANVVLTPAHNARGELIGFSKVTRDLTERRRTEEERLKRAQAEEALLLRDEFLAIASHELRTPLQALRLQLDGLSRQLKTGGAGRPPLERADKARGQLGRLERLVMVLLDVSRIASGRFLLNPEEMDLAELTREALARLAGELETAQIKATLHAPPALRGNWDPLRLDQIVSNLLSNAVKYGEGSAIDVSLTEEPGFAVLTVRDGGPGIAAEDQGRVFLRFERATDSRRISGFGLGLWISRTAVEAHGGTLTVESTPGKGAVFTVRLPLETA